MKLYIEDNEVLFDYSDVDVKVESSATMNYRRFLRNSNADWEFTLKTNVKRLKFIPWEWTTAYGNAREYLRLVNKVYAEAFYSAGIEISEDFKDYVAKIEAYCAELRQAEVEKENERKAKERWAEVCKYGCGRCANKQRWADDFMCSASGDFLPDKEVPCSYGGIYYPFNREAFPTDNCPFNINKTKESA